MSPRPSGRTAPCGRAEAVIRLSQAQKFLEVAQLVSEESDGVPASGSVSASLAVLAGIAAADAACCAALGRRSRGQDHKQAVELAATVSPGGPRAAKSLDRLLDLKDTAHYGVIHVSGADLKSALRHADGLVTFARGVLRR